MSVLFVSVSDALGGSEIALLDMIGGLRRAQPSWRIGLLLPGSGPLLARAEAAGADCTIVPLPRAIARVGEFGMSASGRQISAGRQAIVGARLLAAAAAVPSYLRALRRAIRAYQPSIVHTNGFKAHVLGARAVGGRTGSVRLVWHMHEYVGDRAVSRKLLAAHAARPAAVLANSVSVASDVRRALPAAVPPTVLYNAVDLASFVPVGAVENLDARAGLTQVNGSVVRVGLIATFARWKGHEVFLRAIAALPASLPIRAYVIGEPLYATAGSQYHLDELRQLASDLGVADRVGFTGYLSAPAALRALDVVVHASTRPEPFGLVIAEAMACGRATIVSAGGGAAELVEPEVDALTHSPGNAAELAHQIARLAVDPSLRRTLGARAHATARRRFDSIRLATELAEIYERL